MIDHSKIVVSSLANSFKNTGVYRLSIELPTSYTAFQEQTNSATVTLAENQVFVFAQAKFAEYSKGVSGSTTTYWQRIPTFDGYAVSGTGPQAFYLYSTVNGNTVTFTIGSKNAYGTSETYTAQTVQIEYVTYTIDS